MPHNLYLHSSLSQTRKINHKDKNDVRKAVRFMTWIQISNYPWPLWLTPFY